MAGAQQAAGKGQISGEKLEKHTSGAEAHIDFIGFMPGINPRPTARLPRPTARLPRPTARNPRPTARIPRPTARLPRPTARIPRPTARIPRPTVRIPRPTVRMGFSAACKAHLFLWARSAPIRRRSGQALKPCPDTKHLRVVPGVSFSAGRKAWVFCVVPLHTYASRWSCSPSCKSCAPSHIYVNVELFLVWV